MSLFTGVKQRLDLPWSGWVSPAGPFAPFGRKGWDAAVGVGAPSAPSTRGLLGTASGAAAACGEEPARGTDTQGGGRQQSSSWALV